MSHTITAMFATTAEAEKAAGLLVSELGVDRGAIHVSAGGGPGLTGADPARPYDEKGFFASLKDLFLPDEDRYAYAEGMRRGSALLTATVEESHLSQVSDVLEHAGAVDLDAQEATWRQEGWTGYDATAHTASRSVSPVAAPAPMPAATGLVASEDTIKVIKEDLVVGKRAIESGRVKVRAYVIERPVEETISLHEESVHIDRHAVDRPASAADLAAFQERTIEARAMSEEAVVAKEARVVEEIGIHKDAADRSETIHDTVRETKVDVEDSAGTIRPGPVAPVGTGVAAVGDRKLDMSISGTSPRRP